MKQNNPHQFNVRDKQSPGKSPRRTKSNGEAPFLNIVLKIASGNLSAQNRSAVRDILRRNLDSQNITHDREQVVMRMAQEDAEAFEEAVDRMIAIMRPAVDMWIDSGKDPANPDSDNPSCRNVEDLLHGRSTTLLRLFDAALFRHFRPTTTMMRDGRQGVTPVFPRFVSSDLVDQGPGYALNRYAERISLHYLAKLLDSSDSRRIARCDQCREYFAYQRARTGPVKHGVFCSTCSNSGALKRTHMSRGKRLQTAAEAWLRWERNQPNVEQWRWVAWQVNEAHGTDFGRRWVSQNMDEILKRVEVLRDAKALTTQTKSEK